MRVIEFLLSGVCHQLASHCLVYEDVPLPVCARCSGTFVGASLTLALLWLLGEGRRSELPSWRRAAPFALWAVLWAVDGVNSLLYSWGPTALYTPSNALRMLTGVGVGLLVGIVLYPAYHYALWRDTIPKRVLSEGSHALILALAGAAVVAGSLWWRSAPRWFFVSLNVASVATVFALVNGLLVALLIHKRGMARRHWQVLPYLAIGLALGIIETGAMALLRSALERWV